MLASAQNDLLEEIFKSWLQKKSNYILVCPPMNGERNFFNCLTSESLISGVIGEHASKLALAHLDTMDFKSDLQFARSVARSWDVSLPSSIEDDAQAILEYSCEQSNSQNLFPVIIIHRFHEALDKLGEDIGSTLRNLEHSHGLKTVVTMPISLTELRNRWEMMDPEKAPFLASDWGQGHRVKVVKGYSASEISSLGKSIKLADIDCKALFKATGGLIEIVELLLPEIEGKAGNGLVRYLQSRSSEVCERVLEWLDPKGKSLTYTKSVVSLLNSNFYTNDVSYVKLHDWNSLLIGKDGSLNFQMLAWAASSKLSRSKDFNLLKDLRLKIESGDYVSSLNMVKILYSTDEKNTLFWSILKDLIVFFQSISDVFSDGSQWSIANRKLSKVLARLNNKNVFEIDTTILESWRPICEMLQAFFLVKTSNPNVRVEEFVCTGESEQKVVAFLQLLSLRLYFTQHMKPFESLQGIVAAPESLLQVYANQRHGVCFWQYPTPSAQLSEKIEKIARKPYRISAGRLGYSDLAHIILALEEEQSECSRLISGFEELKTLLTNYEIRKELVHGISFASEKNLIEYRRFLESLLERYFEIMNLTEKRDLPLPYICALNLIDKLIKQ